MTDSLDHIVTQYPFPAYAAWWPMGNDFIRFMAEAIHTQWAALPGHSGDMAPVQAHASDYIHTVYQRPVAPDLVRSFIRRPAEHRWQSGEFDALSYAFFRHAFELLARASSVDDLPGKRRSFTQRVGRDFFEKMAGFLDMTLPDALQTERQFQELKQVIQEIGDFLKKEGYLRDHFAFRFDVNTSHGGDMIHQTEADFLSNLPTTAYALYEMGYPAILPSAVYLFHLLGEAQHHSSRTIEELFDRIGCEARETDDFDPTGFPADLVVELWEIHPRKVPHAD